MKTNVTNWLCGKFFVFCFFPHAELIRTKLLKYKSKCPKWFQTLQNRWNFDWWKIFKKELQTLQTCQPFCFVRRKFRSRFFCSKCLKKKKENRSLERKNTNLDWKKSPSNFKSFSQINCLSPKIIRRFRLAPKNAHFALSAQLFCSFGLLW